LNWRNIRKSQSFFLIFLFFLSHKIPCLNDVKIHELKPNCLVRYRCMIQDSFDPIYFSSSQKLTNPNTNETVQMTFKYKEHLEVPEGFVECTELPEQLSLSSTDRLENAMQAHLSKRNQINLEQRMTFYCVPIPGETNWVKNVSLSRVLSFWTHFKHFFNQLFIQLDLTYYYY